MQENKILETFKDSRKITEAIQSGIDAALLKHKQAGNPVCESKNGKVYWIPAEQIIIPDRKV